MKEIRVVVVDDEPLAREHAIAMLGGMEGFRLVGEASDGREAVHVLFEQQPDLLILDIQMPELSGFDVLAALPVEELPFVVFMTAHDEYALRAFRVHALDYLVKPVEPSRFRAAMERAREIITGLSDPAEKARLALMLRELQGARQAPERLVVRSKDRVLFLKPEEVDWIEAAGNYVRLHQGDKSYLLRRTMVSLEETLPSREFVRIQRSVIINVERLAELRHEGKDEYVVVLRDGRELSLSPRYREALERILGRF